MSDKLTKQYVAETIERVHENVQAAESLNLTDEQLVALRENGDTIYQPGAAESDRIGSHARNMVAYVMTGDFGTFHLDWMQFLHGLHTERGFSNKDRAVSEREFNRVARIVGAPQRALMANRTGEVE